MDQNLVPSPSTSLAVFSRPLSDDEIRRHADGRPFR